MLSSQGLAVIGQIPLVPIRRFSERFQTWIKNDQQPSVMKNDHNKNRKRTEWAKRHRNSEYHWIQFNTNKPCTKLYENLWKVLIWLLPGARCQGEFEAWMVGGGAFFFSRSFPKNVAMQLPILFRLRKNEITQANLNILTWWLIKNMCFFQFWILFRL